MPMSIRRHLLFMFLMSLTVSWCRAGESGTELPEFGRDTVLVWEISMRDSSGTFVARLAGFRPDVLFEWEDSRSQGTVFISDKDVREAKAFLQKKLFRPGVDVRSDNEITLWLSLDLFRTLKDGKKAKCDIDHVPGRFDLEGNGEITVDVNGSPMELPVIRVGDDRGSERWFLDIPENPLMVKYTRAHYAQTLVSITTSRKNTLRWLKGKKLRRLLPE